MTVVLQKSESNRNWIHWQLKWVDNIYVYILPSLNCTLRFVARVIQYLTDKSLLLNTYMHAVWVPGCFKSVELKTSKFSVLYVMECAEVDLSPFSTPELRDTWKCKQQPETLDLINVAIWS